MKVLIRQMEKWTLPSFLKINFKLFCYKTDIEKSGLIRGGQNLNIEFINNKIYLTFLNF